MADYWDQTDPVIARSTDVVRGPVLIGQGHMRSNASYVIERRPEVIRIGRDPRPDVPTIAAVRALLEHPEFHSIYVWDSRLHAYRVRRRPMSALPHRYTDE